VVVVVVVVVVVWWWLVVVVGGGDALREVDANGEEYKNRDRVKQIQMTTNRDAMCAVILQQPTGEGRCWRVCVCVWGGGGGAAGSNV
jgi:hypothetical protein